MNRDEQFVGTSPEMRPDSFGKRVRRWWQADDTAEEYLAAATDLADLERRLRILERASGGPVFVTFNH